MLPDRNHALRLHPRGQARRAGRWVNRATVAALAALVLAACASKPPENPDARACLPPENPAMKAKDYNMRLAGYTNRADAFARCMTEHGYVLDEKELDARLTHFEAVKNANVTGGRSELGHADRGAGIARQPRALAAQRRSQPCPQIRSPRNTLKFPPILQI